MKAYTRNTILYSVLTVVMVASYWVVRQDAIQFEARSSGTAEMQSIEFKTALSSSDHSS